MKAGVLVVGLVLMVVVPAGAQHGGGGHFGGFGGGHFGGHFGGHRGHARSAHWGSAHGLSHVVGSPRLTTFVGFGSTPVFRLFFVTDSFFCPLVPHRVSPFCRFCGLGLFGFPSFGIFDGFGAWLDGYSQPAPAIAPPAGSSPTRPVLVFTNGWTFEVRDYWIDDEGELRYVTTYGGMNTADLQSLDLYAPQRKTRSGEYPSP